MTSPAPHELRLTAEQMRALGHQVVDLVVDHMSGQRDRPVHRRVAAGEVDHLLDEAIPEDPADPGGLVDFLAAEVLPRSLDLGHPGCFAFIPSVADEHFRDVIRRSRTVEAI